jgi:hypothetical protein
MPGEGWVFKGLDPVQDSFFVRVDSISYRIIAQDTLRVMHTTYEIIPGIPYFWFGDIIERVGSTCFLGPHYDLCELGICEIRCYEDAFYQHHFVTYPCDSTIVLSTEEEVHNRKIISLHPNPACDILKINSTLDLTRATLRVFNSRGETVLETILTGNEETIKLLSLRQGAYF